MKEAFVDDVQGSSLRAVLELGTTAIRMVVAQVSKSGSPEFLESLHQSIALGRDSFSGGRITRTTTEQCVTAARRFRELLRQYRIDKRTQYRAVATSAVYEASNRDAFLDRLLIATGIEVEVLDDNEVAHLLFLGLQAHVDTYPALRKGPLLVAETGGGSSQLLLISKGCVVSYNTLRLGSLRLRQMLDDYGAPLIRQASILREHVDSALNPLRRQLSDLGKVQLLALGGDARLVARAINENWDRHTPLDLPAKDFEAYTKRVLKRSVDELVQKQKLSWQEAETLGPALLVYTQLLEMLGSKRVTIAATTLREGLLVDLGPRGSEIDDLGKELLDAAMRLGDKYGFDRDHAGQVRDHALTMFDALAEEHGLGSRQRRIMSVAALLHDIGQYIDLRAHHKHSQYLIQNSRLFGIGHRDLLLSAQVARYHRRALPSPSHPDFARLERSDRLLVSKLAAILRVADALDVAHSKRVRKMKAQISKDRFILQISGPRDLYMERTAVKRKGDLFLEVFGKSVELRSA